MSGRTGRPRAGRVDANQKIIVEALENDGVIVAVLSAVGDGMDDLLCAVPDELFLIECKVAGEKLTPKEKDWHRKCPWRNHVCYTPAEALLVAAHYRAKQPKRAKLEVAA